MLHLMPSCTAVHGS